jgi:hypothetical protein
MPKIAQIQKAVIKNAELPMKLFLVFNIIFLPHLIPKILAAGSANALINMAILSKFNGSHEISSSRIILRQKKYL